MRHQEVAFLLLLIVNCLLWVAFPLVVIIWLLELPLVVFLSVIVGFVDVLWCLKRWYCELILWWVSFLPKMVVSLNIDDGRLFCGQNVFVFLV